MSDLTTQEIDSWRAALAPLAPEYRLYVDLLHAAARRGAEMVDYCAKLGWRGWSPKELVEHAAGQVDAYKRRAEKAEAALAAIQSAQPQGDYIAEVLSHTENKVVPNETFTAIVPFGKSAPPVGAKLYLAQPEYPSAADDEATRWRHGEPVAQPVSDERIEQIYDETAGAMGDDFLHAGWLAFARALLREARR